MKVIIWLTMTAWSFGVYAQNAVILPRNINQIDYNSVYPAVSGDEKVMLYMTDYSDNGSFIMVMSKYRAGKWQTPEDLDVLGSSVVNNWGGYCLNYDGSKIFFSSRRSNGVGKFDIWYSKLHNGSWSRPINLGKPVNSTASEGNPSISPDEHRIYFMRCNRMTTSVAKECKLYYSELGPQGWGEAIELPDYINQGNTTSPRILADNRTLVFASDRPGGKGGIDIWMTRRTGDHWSDPVNVEAVNTSKDDLFLSVSLRSVAYFTTLSKGGKKAIAKVRLPKENRLQNVIIKQGTISDESGKPLAADIRAYAIEEEKYESRIRTSSLDGKFLLILPEGSTYDVSYNDIRLTKLYKAEIVDAREMIAPRREYPRIVLKDIHQVKAFPLQVFAFKPYSSEIDEKISTIELSRLHRIMQYYKNLNIEVGVYLKSYQEDSIQATEDLTELRIDTVTVYEPAIRIDTMANNEKDSLLMAINQELAATLDADTLVAGIYLERMSTPDSVAVQKQVVTYHNNRTPAQANAVKEHLVNNGIDPSRIDAVGYNDETPPVEFPDNQETLVVIRFLNEPQK